MMTPTKADAEAKRRWGHRAGVQWMANGYKAVGVVVMGMMFQVRGSSHVSWEEAFARAECLDCAARKQAGPCTHKEGK